MRKTILTICCALIMASILLPLGGCAVVSIRSNATGKVVYEYKDVQFEEDLTAQEVAAVAEILNGKTQDASILSGAPSCGFDRNIAIIMDGTRYALACDQCGTLQNCTTLAYIHISDAERQILEEIFTSRGGTFPCV